MKRKILQMYRYIKTRWFEFRICIKEFKSGSRLSEDAYKSYFENSLLVEVHSVEKGLGLKNIEPGHGASVVMRLLDRLFIYIAKGYNINDFSFKETYRVLIKYIEFQKQFDTKDFKAFDSILKRYNKLCEKLGDEYIQRVCCELKAGAYTLSKEELMKGTKFDFGKFIDSRHSIRMYEKKEISLHQIEETIQIANRAPSACNRQPSKVYFSNTEAVVQKIDQLISGSSGFKGETPNYIIVTTDRVRFTQEEEFQWYINGGIYLSYLTLALHSLGIGSCIMQWKAFYKTERELKKLLSISEREAIIAIVGCGYYCDDTKYIEAQRKAVGDTLIRVE